MARSSANLRSPRPIPVGRARGLQRRRCWAIGAITLVVSGVLHARSTTALPDTVNELSPDHNCCGPNSVRMLLQLLDCDPGPSHFQFVSAPNDNGASLAELRDVAAGAGLPAEIICFPASADPTSLPTPSIAHLRDVQSGRGHYVTIVDTAGGKITYLDGTTGERLAESVQRFRASWDGYALLPQHAKTDLASQAVVAAATAICGISVLAAARVRRSVRAWAKASTGLQRIVAIASLILTALFPNACRTFAATPLPKTQVPSSPDSAWFDQGAWRTHSRDGVNCLYLQMKWNGLPTGYRSFRDRIGDGRPMETLTDLAAAAQLFGHRLQPARLTATQLMGMRDPVIVHQEPTGIESGRFALLLRLDKQAARLIDGPDMRWTEVPREQFERNWSGYALVPADDATSAGVLRRAFAVIAISAGVIVYASRPRASRDLALKGDS